MGRRKVFATAVLGAASALSLAAPANADHFSGWNSVDNGEIRYQDNTKYNSALSFGIEKWNGLSGPDFKPDSFSTIEDLNVTDVSGMCSASWIGRATPQIGADKVELNVCLMDQSTQNERWHVAAHELGHTLGIGDHGNIQYYDAMMYATKTSYLTLSQHDIHDYVALW